MMTKLHTVDVVDLKALAKTPTNNESTLKIEAASSSTLQSSFVWTKALCIVIAATSPSLSPSPLPVAVALLCSWPGI
jgi:hypothetical protein